MLCASGRQSNVASLLRNPRFRIVSYTGNRTRFPDPLRCSNPATEYTKIQNAQTGVLNFWCVGQGVERRPTKAGLPKNPSVLVFPPRENFRFPDPFPVRILSPKAQKQKYPQRVLLFLCVGQDSNLRSPKARVLQTRVIDHYTTDAFLNYPITPPLSRQ